VRMEVPAARLVIVLGREPVVDIEQVVRRAWHEKSELVILNLGLPLTARQQDTIDAAMEAAGNGTIGLEARICYDARQVASNVHPSDEVILALSPRERRRIDKALRRIGR
jgi:hypothetical protein